LIPHKSWTMCRCMNFANALTGTTAITIQAITNGKLHDVNILDILVPEPGAFYIMDRGYLDFARLYFFTQLLPFFVTRAKKNTRFRRSYSHPVDQSDGLQCDQTIMLVTPKSRAGHNYYQIVPADAPKAARR